jgi:hypothetical protein
MSGNATTRAADAALAEVTAAEAAALLGMPVAALERWAERLAFPNVVGEGCDARFRRREVEALRDALATSHSVEGAVRAARASSAS